MNVETGVIYRGQAAIDAAIKRGESVVPVSDRVARFMEVGQSVDAVSLDDLKKRIETLEGKSELERRMKSLGLVMPAAGGAEGGL